MKALRIILIILTTLFFVNSSLAQYRASANLAVLGPSGDSTFNEASVNINGTPIVSVGTFTTNRQASGSRSFAGNFPSNFTLSTDFGFDPDIAPTNFCADINGNIVTAISTNRPIPSNTPLDQTYQENITNLFPQCNAQLINLNVNQSFAIWRLRDLPIPTAGESTVGIEDTIVLDPQNARPSTSRVLYDVEGLGNFVDLNESCDDGTVIIIPIGGSGSDDTCPAQISLLQGGAIVDVDLIPDLPPLPAVVRFRLDYGNGVLSNIVTYTIVGNSPEIVGSPIVQNPNCSYDDGGFTVTFNRPLNDEEMLTSLSLRSAGADGNLDTADDIPNYQSIDSATYDSNQFTWPLPISAGLYRLSYQSGGANSLEISDPILIESPPPLIYTIESYSDLSCFDSNDGEVRIIINPTNQGTPPYYYTINNGSQIPFTGLSTIVSNLGPDTVQFKVFDSEDCTQRQN